MENKAKNKSKFVTLRIEPELADWLDGLAGNESRSALIRSILWAVYKTHRLSKRFL